jgi:hypothetical protein
MHNVFSEVVVFPKCFLKNLGILKIKMTAMAPTGNYVSSKLQMESQQRTTWSDGEIKFKV